MALNVVNPLQDLWSQQYGPVAQMTASGVDPNNWRQVQNYDLQQQRNNGLASFVDQMSQQDPSAQAIGDRYDASNVQAGNLLAKYLGTSPTSMPNEFTNAMTEDRSRVNALLDNPDSIQQSAAYKFRLGQGLEGVDRSMAARGMLGSGNRLAALNDYAQGQASQEYGNQFNRLSGLLGQDTNAWLGDKSANTSAWGAKANALGNYYGQTSSNLNQNQAQQNNSRLGWAEVGLKNSPNPQSWALS